MSQQWAAGLFEGEGCITIGRSGGRKYLSLSVSMHPRDRDVLDRFARTLGVGNVTGPHANGMCRWCISGAKAEEMLRRCYKFTANLGERRNARLDACLNEVRSQPPALTGLEAARLRKWRPVTV